jgi:hypothetical protein
MNSFKKFETFFTRFIRNPARQKRKISDPKIPPIADFRRHAVRAFHPRTLLTSKHPGKLTESFRSYLIRSEEEKDQINIQNF